MAGAEVSGGAIKQTYAWQLRAFVAFQAVVFLAVLAGDEIVGAIRVQDWQSLVSGKSALGVLLPFITLVMDGIVPSSAKAVIVFWRIKHPLPGSQAFSTYGPADPRVDMSSLERRHGPLPIDALGQNRLWYRLFKVVEGHPTVVQAHRSFLLTRDLASLGCLLLAGLGLTGLFILGPSPVWLALAGGLSAQYLLLRQVAANHGRRFVASVLAEASAKGATAHNTGTPPARPAAAPDG